MNTKRQKRLDLARASRLSSVATAALLGGLTPLWAQEGENDVILSALDGSVEIHGKLQDFDGEYYTIATAFQNQARIPANAVSCSGPACPSTVLANAGAAPDDRVTLIAVDEDYALEGRLISFEGDRFVIETDLGQLQVSSQHFRCEGAICPEVDIYDPRFSIFANATTANYLMPEVLRAYADAHNMRAQFAALPDGNQQIKLINRTTGEVAADISLNIGGTDVALASVASQGSGFALTKHAPDSLLLTGQAADFDWSFSFAHDADVVIVGDDNPVRDMNGDELRALWSGDTPTWERFGGGTRNVQRHIVGSPELTGADEFAQLLPARLDLETDLITYHDTVGDMVQAVRADPTAIGLVDRVEAIRGGADMLGARKGCGLIAQPTDFDIGIKNYPYANTISAHAMTDTLHPVAMDFLEWAQTPQAQSSISDAGFASTQLQRMRIQDMGVALIHNAAMEPDFRGAQFAQMMRELRFADRLSISFRFPYGSSRLDAVSVAAVEDLVVRLRDNQFDGLELLLVGFADNVGDPGLNTRLAQSRAEAVADVITDAFSLQSGDPLNVRALSFGEQMPIACNDTEEGRASNRRVEVWVRVPEGAGSTF